MALSRRHSAPPLQRSRSSPDYALTRSLSYAILRRQSTSPIESLLSVGLLRRRSTSSLDNEPVSELEASTSKSFLLDLCYGLDTRQSCTDEHLVQCIDHLLSDPRLFDTTCDKLFAHCRIGETKCVSTKSMHKIISELIGKLENRHPDLMNQLEDVLQSLEDPRIEENSLRRDEVYAYLLTVLTLIRDYLQADTQGAGERSVQPVRLRMTSSDKYCIRSMEVEWDNRDGERQVWSSWDDQVQNGWYEAEKVLPSDAVAIKVYFKIRGIKTLHAMKVDRKNGCKWVKDQDTKKKLIEIFNFRCNADATTEPIDTIFKLKGRYGACYVQKAWNVGRLSTPEDWEYWEDGKDCPTFARPLASLRAADEVAPPSGDSHDLFQFLLSRQARLKAAVRKLVEIREETIIGLRKIDKSITRQWLRINSANTATAGLAVGAAVTVFVAPPVGVGLGLAAAAAGGGTTAADVSRDSSHMKSFREQLSTDNLNTIAVAELENEWLIAREKFIEACVERENSGIGNKETLELGINRGGIVRVGSVLTNVVNGVTAWPRGAHAVNAMVKSGVASGQVFGVFGAVISTGVAVHGWSTTKFSQKTVRAKLEEMKLSLEYMQRYLADLEPREDSEDLSSMYLRECSVCAQYTPPTHEKV